MEQAELGEDRSSISDPLDPEEETLIWSAGTFLDPSLTVRRLETEIRLILCIFLYFFLKFLFLV